MEVLLIGEIKKGNLLITHRIHGELLGENEILVSINADIYDNFRSSNSTAETIYIMGVDNFFKFIGKLDKDKYARIL